MKTHMKWLWMLSLLILIGCVEGAPVEIPFLATHTPTVTLTPTYTATFTPTPTPTSTPTPTPTPTPIPREVLETAERAYDYGDWDEAEMLYQDLLTLPTLSQDQAQLASLGLGRTLLTSGNFDQAINVLRDFTATDTQSGHVADAHLLLADALMQVGDPAAALEHYRVFAQTYPVLALYTLQWQGDAAFAAGDYEMALNAYQDAQNSAETPSQQVFLWEKIALTHAANGAYAEAMAAYDAILDIAQIARYRARIMYQAAETALAFGEREQAYSRMQTLIQAYPTESYAYEALIQLVEAGQPVDDRLRGLIDYYAEAYGPAVQAFYRVINADPDHGGEPHYYAGLSFLEAGSYDLALQEFETLLDTHPESDYWGSAWLGKGAALYHLGQVEAAVAAYQALPEQLPEHPRATESLWEAAEILEDTADFAKAASALVDLADRYPNDEGAPEARFQAGLLHYRADAVAGAQAAWRALTAWYPYSDRAQAAYFWMGKTYLQASNTVSATEVLSKAVAMDAWSFYGLRAADLLAGQAPFARERTDYDTLCSSAENQRAAEAWLATWLELESTDGLADLPASLLNDSRLRRGTLLLRLGHFDEGRAELEALRDATTDDALTQYRLALYFREIGLYRSSIIAASTLWRLSPANTIQELPRFLGCLIYPTYYSDLVEQEATRQNLDPLFVYALLRQESLFEGYATSYAAAHGLMQVIPPTGAQIADTLDWPPNYGTADLYRPMVSVRFGTWYLAQQRDRIDGNLFAAMAGYNGGPGNSEHWWNLADKDQDLFAELIAFYETRLYVRRIYEHYAKYVWLYEQDE